MNRDQARRLVRIAAVIAVTAIAPVAATKLNAPALAAQSLGIGGNNKNPIQVYAGNGIEWNQNTRQYIARGNAKAIQGDTTVYGDTLVAYYEEVPGGNTEIYRLDALGSVRIVSPTETAYGDKGVYDVRNGVLVLTGRNLRYVTPDEIITARDSLEYYEQKKLAVARGNAVSRPAPAKKTTGKKPKKTTPAGKGNDRTVRADILTARFRDDQAANAKKKTPSTATGGTRGNTLERMDAWGNVIVTRPGEIARGARGVYFPERDIANLWGKVRITRAGNQLNGEFAEVNFATGISRILSSPSAPVQALIEQEKTVPKRPDTEKNSPKSKN
jgi:lipopolysaccharide export system protein LptA